MACLWGPPKVSNDPCPEMQYLLENLCVLYSVVALLMLLRRRFSSLFVAFDPVVSFVVFFAVFDVVVFFVTFDVVIFSSSIFVDVESDEKRRSRNQRRKRRRTIADIERDKKNDFEGDEKTRTWKLTKKTTISKSTKNDGCENDEANDQTRRRRYVESDEENDDVERGEKSATSKA